MGRRRRPVRDAADQVNAAANEARAGIAEGRAALREFLDGFGIGLEVDGKAAKQAWDDLIAGKVARLPIMIVVDPSVDAK